MVGAGTVNEFKSRLNAHSAISPLLYDHRATSTWDSREELGARSLHAGLLFHVRLNTGPPNSSLFEDYDLHGRNKELF